MTLLRRVLRWQAGLWAAFGLALAVAPGWFVEVLLDQSSVGEDAWLRTAGVMAVALAAQMVLVGHRIEELWWWSWTFVFLEIGMALVFVLNATIGFREDSAVWGWWMLALVSVLLAGWAVVALAKAGTERSPT